MLYNAWPEILSQGRRKLGISCEKAAERAGVAVATWYRWEKGITYPGPQYLGHMARGLGMEEDELGMLYSDTMTRHYRDCVGGNAAASEPDVIEEVTLETAGSALEIRGVTSASGVWVNLNDLLEKISEATASEPERARLTRRHPYTERVAVRRRRWR